MFQRNAFAKTALTAAAGVMAFGAIASAPVVASAQPYGGSYTNTPYAYDGCQREQTNRGTVGGILGALAGAAIGSNLAAHHGGRMGGAAIGGVAGAFGGAAIGKSSAACEKGQYSQAAPPPPGPQAAYDGPPPGYYRQDSYRHDDYGYDWSERVVVNEGPPPPRAENCTLAESPIYLPDGRIQKRFVRVCQDANGRYQVVD